MTHIMSFFNNSKPPNTDGITVYKINAKTYERVEVGYLALNGRLMLRSPKKSLGEIDNKKINVYYPTLKVYSLDNQSQICTRTIKSNVDEFLISDTEDSIGYWDNSRLLMNDGEVKLVFWDQYL